MMEISLKFKENKILWFPVSIGIILLVIVFLLSPNKIDLICDILTYIGSFLIIMSIFLIAFQYGFSAPEKEEKI